MVAAKREKNIEKSFKSKILLENLKQSPNVSSPYIEFGMRALLL
jgi:hypothetical protein